MEEARDPRGAPAIRAVRAIYDERYARDYRALYVEPWREKHDENLRHITDLFDELQTTRTSWLDLACGQAWHFSQIERGVRKCGLDISPAQLRHARTAARDARFVCADMGEPFPLSTTFDLVTSFWAAYCYLDDEERIRSWLVQARDAVRTGGALYVEVLLAEDLASFNRSRYAKQTSFRVIPRDNGFERWGYRDSGGTHRMSSPPLSFFRDLLEGHFASISSRHDGRFMVHLIARGRL